MTKEIQNHYKPMVLDFPMTSAEDLLMTWTTYSGQPAESAMVMARCTASVSTFH